MIEISTIDAVILGAALAVLVIGGALMLYSGLRAKHLAQSDLAGQRRLTALVGAAPARPMVVRGDGRLEMPPGLADWLGLSGKVDTFEALLSAEPGIATEDRDRFASAIRAGQRGGRDFRLALRAANSTRRLIAVGDRAPSDLNAPGGVLVWFFDATELQSEVERLDHEVAELRAAFKALSELIEVAPMPMWYRGHDLRLAMVNSAYVRAVEGRDAADVIDRQIELVESQGREGPIASAADARDSGKPQRTTLPATINGARRMLELHDIAVPSGGTAGFGLDIEELEQTRAGMKRFVEAQRAMLDRLSAGVAQFSADRNLVFCNQPFRSLFALRPEWLADRPEFDRVLERMREAKRLPEVRDFPGWKAERRDWFTMPENAVEEHWNLPGAVHLRVVAQALPEGGLLVIFEDRTEQVQLASARDTLLRVRTATFDNLSEALGVFAADGRLQIWNAKFRQVWAFEEALLNAHPRVDQLAKDASVKLKNESAVGLIPELVRSATAHRQQRGGRLTFADGRHFDLSAVPLPDGNALLTMLDVTDSRRIEVALRDRNEALEAADRVKTAFVANMSYELRTPLTSIKGFAEMMAAGLAGELPEAATGYVSAILESTDRLGMLVDDVLDLTANEAAELEKTKIVVSDLLGDAAQSVKALASERKIKLAMEVEPSADSLIGDARRLRETVEHLLRHAIGHLPKGREVLLYADGTAKRVRIIVSDNGPGMDAAAQTRAFDRFIQGSRSRADERPLGLSLPLAKQFVEAHGGKLTLVSERGAGTMLTAELPRG